jgi:hypothetical protein
VQEVLGYFQERLAYSQEPMEDFAGEEVTKKNMNLNTTPYVPKVMKKRYDFHFRGKIKIRGKEEDTQECRECKKIFPLLAFTTKYLRADGAWVLKKQCRQCDTKLEAERTTVKKNAPPRPEKCDCCHTIKPLTVDHIHGTIILRGWLCNNCNVGIGHIEDNLEGVLRAAVYLEKDKSKIIEKLNDLE